MAATRTSSIQLQRESARPAARLGRGGSVRPIALHNAEALELPADLLAELPLPPKLALHVPGVPGIVRVLLDAEGEGEPGALTFDAEEWRAIVLGAQADRLWPSTFVALCARKRDEPAWRIDAEMALAGAQPDPRQRFSVARVLSRLGAQVLAIEVD